MPRNNMLTSRRLSTGTITLAMMGSIFGQATAAIADDCFDNQRIGLYTERHYSELDAKTRNKAGDPKIDHMATTALRGTRANVVSIRADTRENAVILARDDGLPVLVFLDVEAGSFEIEMQFGQTNLVTIEAAARLQFLSSANGTVLGESSDFGKSSGLDIEQALPAMLQPTLASMAEEAAREACKNGLISNAVVAQAPSAPSPTLSPEDRALITDLQHVLADLGYDVGVPDGLAGGLTRRAIQRAEADLRQPVTGKPSEPLLVKLNERLVTNAQSLLRDLGKIKGEPSGVLNRETRIAIKAIEREQGLFADGEPDGDVMNILEAKASGAQAPLEQETEIDAGLRYRIEELLVDLGFLQSAPSGEDSFDLTEAIRQAEIELGLPVDGVPDLSLYRKLQSTNRGS